MVLIFPLGPLLEDSHGAGRVDQPVGQRRERRRGRLGRGRPGGGIQLGEEGQEKGRRQRGRHAEDAGKQYKKGETAENTNTAAQHPKGTLM